MNRIIPNLLVFLLTVVSIISSSLAWAQPGGYAVHLQSNNNFANGYVFTPAPAAGIVAVTVQASSNANGYIVEWDNWYNKWYNTGTQKNAPVVLTWGDGTQGRPDSQLNGGFISGKSYTFQIRGYAYSNRDAVIMETDNAPQSFHATSPVSGPGYVCAATPATINITLAGAKSPQERVFVRYAVNGNYNNSKVVEAIGSGNTWSSASAIIPADDHAAGTTISYYAYTTTVAATNNIDHDLITLRFATNNLNNYSYPVNASQLYYADADGDTFGNAAMSTSSCNGAPQGYVANSSDCNDGDNSMNASFGFYVDADGDSFGTGSLVTVCAVNASTPPAGYSLNNTDCNDSDNTKYAAFLFFTDADGDGIGAGDTVSVCAINADTPPAGYSLSNTDCNDGNPNMNTTYMFYIDADNDGYGAGALVAVCAVNAATAPVGYSFTNTDCNDAVAAVNPGTVETYYNGVDDNCDGQLDEGFQIRSKIIDSQCGITLSAMGSTIYAVNINNATAYRFEVTNTATDAVQTIVRPLRWFTLTMLPTYDYATTYAIRVEVQRNGVWLNYYGDSCMVSSPAVLEPGGTGVTGTLCGTVLPSISTIIMTNNINNATGYRFKITNLTDETAPNQVQILDRPIRWFSLPMLANYFYGTTYLVEVAVKTTGGYTDFGTSCTITTPSVPALNNCGQTVATPGTIVSTQSKDKATAYRFEFFDTVTGNASTIDRPLHWFRFNMIPGYVAGRQYEFRVAVMTSGSYSPYGDVCLITAPMAARFDDIKNGEQPALAFKAIAYPNPYAETFALDVTTANDSDIQIKIYDMTGKLLEVRTVAPTVISQQQLGERFASGVYNIIITQGDEVKSLRVIKR